ncbi:hypothetical protein ABO04_07270 [Nitrosomonas sp. HPC101]|nr:hypothetical protein [Nitrosomonas sp. HPC101]
MLLPLLHHADAFFKCPLRTVLLQYLVSMLLLVTKNSTYSNRSDSARKLRAGQIFVTVAGLLWRLPFPMTPENFTDISSSSSRIFHSIKTYPVFYPPIWQNFLQFFKD